MQNQGKSQELFDFLTNNGFYEYNKENHNKRDKKIINTSIKKLINKGADVTKIPIYIFLNRFKDFRIEAFAMEESCTPENKPVDWVILLGENIFLAPEEKKKIIDIALKINHFSLDHHQLELWVETAKSVLGRVINRTTENSTAKMQNTFLCEVLLNEQTVRKIFVNEINDEELNEELFKILKLYGFDETNTPLIENLIIKGANYTKIPLYVFKDRLILDVDVNTKKIITHWLPLLQTNALLTPTEKIQILTDALTRLLCHEKFNDQYDEYRGWIATLIENGADDTKVDALVIQKLLNSLISLIKNKEDKKVMSKLTFLQLLIQKSTILSPTKKVSLINIALNMLLDLLLNLGRKAEKENIALIETLIENGADDTKIPIHIIKNIFLYYLTFVKEKMIKNWLPLVQKSALLPPEEKKEILTWALNELLMKYRFKKKYRLFITTLIENGASDTKIPIHIIKNIFLDDLKFGIEKLKTHWLPLVQKNTLLEQEEKKEILTSALTTDYPNESECVYIAWTATLIENGAGDTKTPIKIFTHLFVYWLKISKEKMIETNWLPLVQKNTLIKQEDKKPFLTRTLTYLIGRHGFNKKYIHLIQTLIKNGADDTKISINAFKSGLPIDVERDPYALTNNWLSLIEINTTLTQEEKSELLTIALTEFLEKHTFCREYTLLFQNLIKKGAVGTTVPIKIFERHIFFRWLEDKILIKLWLLLLEQNSLLTQEEKNKILTKALSHFLTYEIYYKFEFNQESSWIRILIENGADDTKISIEALNCTRRLVQDNPDAFITYLLPLLLKNTLLTQKEKNEILTNALSNFLGELGFNETNIPRIETLIKNGADDTKISPYIFNDTVGNLNYATKNDKNNNESNLSIKYTSYNLPPSLLDLTAETIIKHWLPLLKKNTRLDQEEKKQILTSALTQLLQHYGFKKEHIILFETLTENGADVTKIPIDIFKNSLRRDLFEINPETVIRLWLPWLQKNTLLHIEGKNQFLNNGLSQLLSLNSFNKEHILLIKTLIENGAVGTKIPINKIKDMLLSDLKSNTENSYENDVELNKIYLQEIYIDVYSIVEYYSKEYVKTAEDIISFYREAPIFFNTMIECLGADGLAERFNSFQDLILLHKLEINYLISVVNTLPEETIQSFVDTSENFKNVISNLNTVSDILFEKLLKCLPKIILHLSDVFNILEIGTDFHEKIIKFISSEEIEKPTVLQKIDIDINTIISLKDTCSNFLKPILNGLDQIKLAEVLHELLLQNQTKNNEEVILNIVKSLGVNLQEAIMDFKQLWTLLEIIESKPGIVSTKDTFSYINKKINALLQEKSHLTDLLSGYHEFLNYTDQNILCKLVNNDQDVFIECLNSQQGFGAIKMRQMFITKLGSQGVKEIINNQEKKESFVVMQTSDGKNIEKLITQLFKLEETQILQNFKVPSPELPKMTQDNNEHSYFYKQIFFPSNGNISSKKEGSKPPSESNDLAPKYRTLN